MLGTIGIVVIIGWLFNIPLLKSILPAFVSMKFNTALCFLLSGIVLWLLNKNQLSFFLKSIIFFFSFFIFLAGILTLFEYLFGTNFSIDELFMKDDPLLIGTSHAGRMSPITTFDFLLVGIVLFLLLFKPKNYKLIQALSLILLTTALFSFSGYLYHIHEFLTVLYNTKMAFHTSVGFFILSISLLTAQGNIGVISFFTNETIGGTIARRLIPILIILELFFGLLHLEGMKAGLFGDHFGVALFSLVNIIILIVIVLWSVNRIMIKEHKRNATEKLLNESQEVAHLGSYLLDLRTGLWKSSKTLDNILGIDSEYVRNIEGWLNTVHPDDKEMMLSYFTNEVIGKKIKFNKEYRVLNIKTGNTIWVHGLGKLEYDEDGNLSRMIGTISDINERKKSDLVIQEMYEKILLQNEEYKEINAKLVTSNEIAIQSKKRFEIMFAGAPLGIALINSLTGQIIEVNKSFENIVGRPKDELVKMDWMSITHPDDIQLDLDKMTLLNSGKISDFRIEKRYIHAKGHVVWINLTVKPLKNDDAVHPQHLCIIEDISERKKGERKIKGLSEILEKSVNETYVFDIKSLKFYFLNFSAVKNLGFNKSEYPNLTLLDIEPEFTRELFFEYVKPLINGEVDRLNFETLHKRQNGTMYPVEVNLQLTEFDGKKSFTSFVQNITERKYAEYERNRFVERIKTLSTAVEQSPITTIITDIKGNIVYVNPKFMETSGYSQAEAIGKNPRIFKTENKPSEDYKEMWNTLLSGKNWTGTFQNKKKNGELYWESAVIAPIKNNNDEITHFLALKEDITEKILAEEKRKKAEQKLMEQSELLVSQNTQLTDFCNIVSHNLRGPIVNISMLIDFIESSKDENERKEIIEKFKPVINNLNESFNELIESIQVRNDYDLKSEKINVKDSVQKILDGMEVEIELYDAKFEMDFDDTPVINFPVKYMNSILFNLINNALKYKSPERKPLISIKTEKINDSIILSVSDNGLGIDLKMHEKNLFKIRKVFHEHPDAKGFGLFMIKTQVEAMGGTIWAKSIPGEGSTFFVKFKNQDI